MDLKKIYNQFVEQNPNYSKEILCYEEAEDNSIKFTFKDGKTAYFYPLVANKSYLKSKKVVPGFKQIVIDEED